MISSSYSLESILRLIVPASRFNMFPTEEKKGKESVNGWSD